MHFLTSALTRWLLSIASPESRACIRICTGALLGILVTGLISQKAAGSAQDLPLLIAPIGASAVILFAAPSSAFARPWAILGGNVTAAFVGVTCLTFVTHPILGASLAVAGAICAMHVLRCLHPPGGAIALTVVLGGPGIQQLGYEFLLWPVGLNSVLLLGVALIFNRAAVYPARAVRRLHAFTRCKPGKKIASETASPAAVAQDAQTGEPPSI